MTHRSVTGSLRSSGIWGDSLLYRLASAGPQERKGFADVVDGLAGDGDDVEAGGGFFGVGTAEVIAGGFAEGIEFFAIDVAFGGGPYA